MRLWYNTKNKDRLQFQNSQDAAKQQLFAFSISQDYFYDQSFFLSNLQKTNSRIYSSTQVNRNKNHNYSVLGPQLTSYNRHKIKTVELRKRNIRKINKNYNQMNKDTTIHNLINSSQVFVAVRKNMPFKTGQRAKTMENGRGTMQYGVSSRVNQEKVTRKCLGGRVR